MSEIPLRLLVISARVPEGEDCRGCQFYSEPDDQPDAWCKLYLECLELPEAKPWARYHYQPPARLPACRERDGWRAVPPDADATIGRQVYEPKEQTR